MQASPSHTIAELKSQLQRLTGVHAKTQRLVFAGATLRDEDLISAALVDGCKIFVFEAKVFPAVLGPFQASAVPWAAKDFELPPLDHADFESQGSMWLMERRALVRHGISSRGAEFPLAGQFSPPHPITLTAEEKAAISIPAAAQSFVWSYPVAASTSAFEGGSDAARSFLSVGGYVYLDASRRIIHATTLLPSDTDAGGLQFKRPAAWRAEWTGCLMRQGRFQRITIKGLNDLGAHHFCWLRPGEVLRAADGTPFPEQPSTPHGGFAYLFHTDVYAGSADELGLDRYFACASGEDYVADEEAGGGDTERRSAQAAFQLVSELSVLQEEAAAQPAAPSEALQGRIQHLERQLDSVTKCVCCLTAEKNTILGCGHVCMCQGCAARVTRCPICRAQVRERRRAFQG